MFVKNNYSISIIFFYLMCSSNILAQIYSDYPCYAVALNNGNSNVLFKYQPSTFAWDSIGITGGYNTKAIAVNGLDEIIYACNGPVFGTINTQTGVFTTIGLIGLTQNGEYGPQLINDVVGLSFDKTNNILYGAQRLDNGAINQNDILIQIDPATGKYIPNTFQDRDGNITDYARIEDVKDGTEVDKILDVEDIALHPQTGELFVTHDQGSPAKISTINKINGNLTRVYFDVYETDVGGLTFTNYDILYGSAVYNNTYPSSDGTVLIDYTYGSLPTVTSIDPTGNNVDFQAIDCYLEAPPNHCSQIINLSNEIISETMYKAEIEITTNNVLNENSSLMLIAGSVITINNNFEVPSSTNLEINIGNCD